MNAASPRCAVEKTAQFTHSALPCAADLHRSARPDLSQADAGWEFDLPAPAAAQSSRARTRKNLSFPRRATCARSVGSVELRPQRNKTRVPPLEDDVLVMKVLNRYIKYNKTKKRCQGPIFFDDKRELSLSDIIYIQSPRKRTKKRITPFILTH